MHIVHSKSTFPLTLGAKISGVDDQTYSSTGEAYSAIVLPHSDSHTPKKLQADDVSLAYECEFSNAILSEPSDQCSHTTHISTPLCFPSSLKEVPGLHV